MTKNIPETAIETVIITIQKMVQKPMVIVLGWTNHSRHWIH